MALFRKVQLYLAARCGYVGQPKVGDFFNYN